jgi:pilus assembly protein Flp/PilA
LSHPRRSRVRTVLSNLIRDESGVTAIEYALIAALIAVAAIAAFTLVGTNLSTTFSTIAGKL